MCFLGDCVGDDVILKRIVEDIADHLIALTDEFQRYFLRIVAENAQNALINNPFRCEVGTVEESLQENSLGSTMTFLQRMNTMRCGVGEVLALRFHSVSKTGQQCVSAICNSLCVMQGSPHLPMLKQNSTIV